GAEVIKIHPRGIVQRLAAASSHDLFFAQLDEPRQMSDIALLQERIGQHLAQRRREPESYSSLYPVPQPRPQDGKQREVCLADRLKQPVFFEELGVLGVTHKRQMRVKNDGEQSVWHSGNSKGSMLNSEEALRPCIRRARPCIRLAVPETFTIRARLFTIHDSCSYYALRRRSEDPTSRQSHPNLKSRICRTFLKVLSSTKGFRYPKATTWTSSGRCSRIPFACLSTGKSATRA